MIYIIAHNKVNFDDLYIDKSFDKNMFNFYITEGRHKDQKVTEDLISKIKNEGFLNPILEWEYPKYTPKLQTETYLGYSVMYHMVDNSVTPDGDFIGFMEYDLSLDIGEESFSNKVNDIIAKHKDETFMIFPSIRHKIELLNQQGNITMNGVHWLSVFLTDYNKRFGTTYNHIDFLNKNKNLMIPTQQSFICDTNTYNKLSKYVFDFIREHRTKIFRPRPSTILERMIGMFLFLESKKCDNTYKIPLIHKHSSGGAY